MSNEVISALASSSQSLATVTDMMGVVRWHWLPKFGDEVLEAIIGVRDIYALSADDIPQSTSQACKRKCAQAASNEQAARMHLKTIFTDCIHAVEGYMDENGQQLCKAFKQLPCRDV